MTSLSHVVMNSCDKTCVEIKFTPLCSCLFVLPMFHLLFECLLFLPFCSSALILSEE